MKEDMLRYLDEIVEPTIAEFEAAPTSRRRAFLACVATFHSIDYLDPKRGEVRARRDVFRKACKSFAIVERVAHAFKHVRADGPDPLRAESVIPRPPAIWGLSKWGEAIWGDETGGVTLDNERDIDILAALKEAVQFLRSQ